VPSRAPSSRKDPKQTRSRAIVESIVEAGRRILEAEGPGALTTNHIAERAGVSIGSLYRYFPNKEAVIAAICETETRRDVSEIRSAERWAIDELPLRESLAAIVDFQIARHQRLVALASDVYRAHQGEFSLTAHMGTDAVVAHMRALLLRHRAAVRVRDLDQAAFLIARGLSAIVRRALEERPAKLHEPAFRDELVDLALLYVTAERPPG
jgi:AcrR family transcriptional regulator